MSTDVSDFLDTISKVEPMYNLRPVVSGKKHLIDVLKLSEDFVRCICSWEGTIKDWDKHRKFNPSKAKAEDETF